MKNFARALTLMGLMLVVGCTSSTSSKSSESDEGKTSASACTEPENPYDEGSGHHAGYEWAEKNDPPNCGGSSQSFIEGCEEYQRQESEYQDCEAKKKK